MSIEGLDKLRDLITKIERRDGILRDVDGVDIDISNETLFLDGPFLHQGDEDMSETESAKFELDNKQAFDYLRHLKGMLNRALE